MLDHLWSADALAVLLTSLGVGVVVGLTGMGGGALMTPALVFLGIPPTAAIANDLVAAAVNKSVGAAVHLRHGTPDKGLVKYLVVGSVPLAFAGAFIVQATGGSADDRERILRLVLGVALLLTATTYTFRQYMTTFHHRGAGGEPVIRPLPTIAVGAVGGLLVGLTSVGSGSVIMVVLLLLYPTLSARRLVGTDLLQAVPLVLAAAVGHLITTGVDLAILVPLLVGGIPGTFVGARLATWVPIPTIRRGIVIVLVLTGLGLLRMPPLVVGAVGAGLLILGPVAWAALRRAHGLPAVYRPEDDLVLAEEPDPQQTPKDST